VSEGDKATLDGAAATTGPCISEPATGSVFPAAWTRPRFFYGDATGAHKITLSSAQTRHELTIYAASLPYVLPLDIWEGLSKSVYNQDITYVVKATSGAEATGTFQIAPVAAGGSMVFWGSPGTVPGETTNALYGFGVGDEGVIEAIQPGEIKGTSVVANRQLRDERTTTPGHSTCVGCHSSTPDGKAIASVDHWPWNVRLYGIEAETRGAAPDYLTPAGAAMIQMSWLGGTTFSKGDWDPGARRMVTTWTDRDYAGGNLYRIYDSSALSSQPLELIWIDLAAEAEAPLDLSRVDPADYMNPGDPLNQVVVNLRGTGWEVVARTGDDDSPILPDWSHDGSSIVYTSTDVPKDGRVGVATVSSKIDLYTVPFAAGAGGNAVPLVGASSPGFFEYYPDYAPDDSLVAFNRIPAVAAEVYYRAESEIYVVPANGAPEPVRLLANDAVCEGTTGSLYNSWAKWAPSSATGDGKTYYFLIFSTTRSSPGPINDNGSAKYPASQLYMTTIVKNADGSITSSPAIYLWNQRNLVAGQGDSATVSELLTNNVTPAWDEFKIPPVPPVEVR